MQMTWKQNKQSQKTFRRQNVQYSRKICLRLTVFVLNQVRKICLRLTVFVLNQVRVLSQEHTDIHNTHKQDFLHKKIISEEK